MVLDGYAILARDHGVTKASAGNGGSMMGWEGY